MHLVVRELWNRISWCAVSDTVSPAVRCGAAKYVNTKQKTLNRSAFRGNQRDRIKELYEIVYNDTNISHVAGNIAAIQWMAERSGHDVNPLNPFLAREEGREACEKMRSVLC